MVEEPLQPSLTDQKNGVAILESVGSSEYLSTLASSCMSWSFLSSSPSCCRRCSRPACCGSSFTTWHSLRVEQMRRVYWGDHRGAIRPLFGLRIRSKPRIASLVSAGHRPSRMPFGRPCRTAVRSQRFKYCRSVRFLSSKTSPASRSAIARVSFSARGSCGAQN